MNKKGSAIVILLAALAAGWNYIPDIGGTPPPIIESYSEALAMDLVNVANGIDSGKTIQEVTDAIEVAFDNAKSQSYLSIADDIDDIDDNDRDGLAALLREIAEEIR